MEQKRQRPTGASSRPREGRRPSDERSTTPETRTRRPRPTGTEAVPPENRRPRRRPTEAGAVPSQEGRRRSQNAGDGVRSSQQGRHRPGEAGRTTASTPRQEGRRRPAPGEVSKKPEKRVPSERSIKAAEKRKAIREENARLFRLRQKQKRQAKRRTVKRISKGLFKRLMIMAGIVVAVILSMVIFFRVENVLIEGNVYYSQQEILQVCGVASGDNLLTLSRSKISGSIMAPLKYVDSVKVTRQLPDTLIIRVTEGKPKYAVQDTGGDWYLITAQGKVMEQITDRQAWDFTMVKDLTITPPTVGEEIRVYAVPGDETKAKGQFSALKTLLEAIEGATLGRHIASVSIPSSFKISLWYEDRFQVELGDTNRMDYKLEYLKAVIQREESYVTGTVDLTLKSGDKAILLRGE